MTNANLQANGQSNGSSNNQSDKGSVIHTVHNVASAVLLHTLLYYFVVSLKGLTEGDILLRLVLCSPMLFVVYKLGKTYPVVYLSLPVVALISWLGT